MKEILAEEKQMDLEINAEKTKIISIAKIKKAGQIKIWGYEFYEVTLTSNGQRCREIEDKIQSASRAYMQANEYWKARQHRKKSRK